MNRFSFDWQLVLPVLVIVVFGLMALASFSPVLAANQLLFLVIASVFFWFFSKFNYSSHQFLVLTYSLAGLLLLTLPFIFGSFTRGAVRWLELGSLTVQPSEIIKPFLIIIFSFWLTRNKIIIYWLLLLVPAFLIFKQPDLGSALVIAAVWLGVLLASRWKTGLLTGVILAALFIPSGLKLLKPYQLTRLQSFVNPYLNPKASGYHLIQSVISVGSGGLWGRGLGRGTQSQLEFLPERHTDFIFATIAENLGFVGAVSLMLAYFFLLKRIFWIARNAPDQFGQLISIGVFCLFLFQAGVNIAMNLGLLPITGITLPLVSSGGSSLVSVFICLGLVQNISLNSPPPKPLEIK